MTCNAAIVTHGDVDGMTCAAQLIRHEKGQCEILYSNAQYIGGKLSQVFRRKPLPERLYVTDIPADERATEVVEKLTRSGVAVIWIDHHPWPDGLNERLAKCCGKLIHNVAMSSPAGVLVGQWLGEQDDYCRQVSRICYAYEEGTEWERNWFRLLSSYVGKSTRDVLDRLAYNRDLVSDDLARIAQKIKDEETAWRMIREPNPPLKTKSGREMVIFDISTIEGEPYLGKKVFDHHDVDYALVRVSARKWQLAANPARELDISCLGHRQDIDGMTVRIGGRYDRLVAIDVSGRAVPADAHKRVVDWLLSTL